MTLSVRIPLRVEQELAEYCATHSVSRSEAVKRALDEFLRAKKAESTPYELGKDLIGPHTDETPSEDIAGNTKRLLRERFRARTK
jgi:hypothetical protein